MAGFHALGTRAKALADDLCGGHMVAVQEGGYALSYTAYCAYATLAGLLGRDLELDDPIAFLPDHAPGLDDLIDTLRTDRDTATEPLTDASGGFIPDDGPHDPSQVSSRRYSWHSSSDGGG